MEERRGFEPLRTFALTVFKTVAIDHSAISPSVSVHFTSLGRILNLVRLFHSERVSRFVTNNVQVSRPSRGGYGTNLVGGWLAVLRPSWLRDVVRRARATATFGWELVSGVDSPVVPSRCHRATDNVMVDGSRWICKARSPYTPIAGGDHWLKIGWSTYDYSSPKLGPQIVTRG